MCWCVVVSLQSVRGMLENPTEAVNELSYFDCIDSVMENSKVPTYVIHSIHSAKSFFHTLSSSVLVRYLQSIPAAKDLAKYAPKIDCIPKENAALYTKDKS